MPHDIAAPLKAWETFYVIIGSSAGALTGLQFVVLTLIAEFGVTSGRKDTISAFGSPNVVHFCTALLVSSILSAPWTTLRYAGVAIERNPESIMFGVGAAVLLLVFIGIHNAWDTVTYVTLQRGGGAPETNPDAASTNRESSPPPP